MKLLLFITTSIIIFVFSGCSKQGLSAMNSFTKSLNENTRQMQKNRVQYPSYNSSNQNNQNFRITNQYGQTRGYVKGNRITDKYGRTVGYVK